ncbi:unnamed protein product [Diatraea saccharalis]|uniref:Uncharacterized protein n=1 Tax=Diatraea saccharalis TaxID=40085 RepID=A0A9N9R5D6_9NEOP|nr:unnamed protein product [Diatraea saccharalis]
MPGLDMKFFIWARGRWRELSLSTGCVDGAGTKPVRFFYVNKDRLEAARGPRVLRALRSLADAKPTEVHDGPPVPQRNCNTSSREASQNVHIRSTHAPCLTDAGVQVSGDELNTIDKGNGKTADRSVKSPLKAAQTETAQVAPQPRAKRKRSRTPTKQNKKHATTDSDGDQSMLSLQLRRRDRPCKELTIAENDVDLYRTYLLKTDPDFDVYRFDTDDNFKMQLFYRIHPLVSLAHCERLERMLHERRISQADISLKDFATKLGLRSVSDQEGRRDKRYKMRRRTVAQSTPSASDETDKENFIVNRRSEPRGNAERDRTLRKRLMVEAVRRNIDKTGALEKVSATKNVRKGERKKEETILVSSSSDSASEFVQKKPKFFTKKPAPKNNPMKLMSQSSKKSVSSNKSHGGREYSNLEDHAIVSFVSGGDRARLVNGNRVWRELEEQYHRLTGHNTYRYITYMYFSPHFCSLLLCPRG